MPMTPVVVGTHPDRKAWINDFVSSVRRTSNPRRRILINHDGGYEPAAIRKGCAKFKRFVLLHDSVTILDPEFWDVIDNSSPSWLAGWPPMCMAIYDADTVRPHLPDHEVTKRESVEFEGTLPSLINLPTIWPEIVDANHLRMEERHGRMNMVLGNHLWEKHKGHWGQAPL